MDLPSSQRCFRIEKPHQSTPTWRANCRTLGPAIHLGVPEWLICRRAIDELAARWYTGGTDLDRFGLPGGIIPYVMCRWCCLVLLGTRPSFRKPGRAYGLQG